MNVATRLAAMLGADAVDVSSDPPVARPRSTEAVAAVLRAAHDAGWRVRVFGAHSWIPADAPADLALATTALTQVIEIASEDLVATVGAGMGCQALDHALAERGVWLPFDAPGDLTRTIGSIVTTATSGPLQMSFGPVKDQLLGLVAVTGDGRIVRVGGRVVKNVAGYDLTRLMVGAFGVFGIVTEAHVRLRARAPVDMTWVAPGPRDELFGHAIELGATPCRPAALEILSPAACGGDDWTLGIRLVGTAAAVEVDAELVRARVPEAAALHDEEATVFWQRVRTSTLTDPVTLRAAALPTAVEETLDEIERHLEPTWVSAGLRHGTVRWSGTTDVATLTRLRQSLAAREVPMTLERAPWALRAAVGHFGVYREGINRITENLRRAFDPGSQLVVPFRVA